MNTSELAELLLFEPDEYPFETASIEADDDHPARVAEQQWPGLAGAASGAGMGLPGVPEADCGMDELEEILDLLVSGEDHDPQAGVWAELDSSEADDDSGPPLSLEGAAILLQSHDEVDESETEELWEQFYDACAGTSEHEVGDLSLEPLEIEGAHGFSRQVELAEEDPDIPALDTHVVHLEFGQNSLRVLGFGIIEEEMEEVVTAQLDRLEEAG